MRTSTSLVVALCGALCAAAAGRPEANDVAASLQIPSLATVGGFDTPTETTLSAGFLARAEAAAAPASVTTHKLPYSGALHTQPLSAPLESLALAIILPRNFTCLAKSYTTG
jgi:hypothetical protein